MSAEATVSRNYLDWLIAVPWYKKTRESRNLARAEQILHEDHYGLDKIKDRILEFLAVRTLVRKPKGTILTLTGPRVSARRRWPSRSPVPRTGSLSGSRWAACATRQRFAGIGARTSARFRARSSR